MSTHERDISILSHMIRYCDQIDAAIRHFGDDEQLFYSDAVFQNAVAMCILQIGELAGHLTEDYRISHPEMPWRQMKSLRNIIAHNYGAVDAETAWEIVKGDIPSLRRFCEAQLESNQ